MRKVNNVITKFSSEIDEAKDTFEQEYNNIRNRNLFRNINTLLEEKVYNFYFSSNQKKIWT